MCDLWVCLRVCLPLIAPESTSNAAVACELLWVCFDTDGWLAITGGKLARPNVLMFGDWAHETSRCDAQEANYKLWKAQCLSSADGSSGPTGSTGSTGEGSSPGKVAVIEIGAGCAVPTVRMEAQHAADHFNVPLIRVNLEDPAVSEHQSQPGVSIALGALEALEQIDAVMKELDEDG